MASSVFGTAQLISGSEALLAERAVQARIRAALGQSPRAELIDLEAAGLADGEFGQVVGGSLFSPETIVVVRNLAELPAELADLLVATAGQVPENLCLVLLHGGGQKGKALLTRLSSAGVEKVAADPLRPSELPAFVAAEARAARVRMDARAAQVLIDAVGSDLRALSSAVAQLASDWEGAELTADMVSRYFAGRAEVTSFQVAEDVLAGRTAEALAKVRWAMDTGVAPVLITSALASQFRALGRYHDIRSVGMSNLDAARSIGVPAWKIKSLDRHARNWAVGSVARAISAVARADAQIKGVGADPGHALEWLVLSIEAGRGAHR